MKYLYAFIVFAALVQPVRDIRYEYETSRLYGIMPAAEA